MIHRLPKGDDDFEMRSDFEFTFLNLSAYVTVVDCSVFRQASSLHMNTKLKIRETLKYIKDHFPRQRIRCREHDYILETLDTRTYAHPSATSNS